MKSYSEIRFLWCCCSAALMFFTGGAVQASEVLHDVAAGSLYTRAQQDQPWQKAVHVKTDVDANISGMVVEVDYQQTFTNASDQWREAIYVFPLGEQTAIYAFNMTIGEREIIGEIKEKSQAKVIYQQAVKAGKKAALLDQHRPNLFRQKIANIAPGESVSIRIKFVESAHFSDGSFTWRLPTTLTPRYQPSAPLRAAKQHTQRSTHGWANANLQVPDGYLIAPPMTSASDNTLAISVTLNPGLPLAQVDALYHQLRVKKGRDRYRLGLRNGRVAMDRDFVLQWQPQAQSMPTAALFKQRYEGEDYAMLMVLPPAAQTEAALPRDLVFVLDTSGSMQGESIRQAKAALALGISRLGDSDRFNIIEFNSVRRSVFTQLRDATPANKQQAIAWVDSLRASGGTEMLPALQQAFMAIGDDSAALKQLVFITDGAVGNEAQLFRSISEGLGGSRLFTVGIGSAPNSYFMRKAAQFGRGTFTYIGNSHEVASAMDALFIKLASAAASDVQLAWPFAVEQYPQKAPDVYRNEPFTVFIKTASVAGEMTIAGDMVAASSAAAVQHWRQNLNLDHIAAAEDSPGVARLWARQKIEWLTDQQALAEDSDSIKHEVLVLGLSHQLLTPYTSFVAVERQVSRPANAAVQPTAIANQLPKGQVLPPTGAGTQRSIPFPATATSLRLSQWLGLLAALFAAVAWLATRRLELWSKP